MKNILVRKILLILTGILSMLVLLSSLDEGEPTDVTYCSFILLTAAIIQYMEIDTK